MNPPDAPPSSPARAAPLTSRERALGVLVLALLSVAMIWPALGPLHADSFPLSTYPMFAKQRGKPRMHKLIGYDAAGAPVAIRPELLGTSEVLQAKSLIDRAAAKSKRERARFCQELLTRAKAQPSDRPIERIELLRVRFDPLTYFEGAGEPIEQQRLASCGGAK